MVKQPDICIREELFRAKVRQLDFSGAGHIAKVFHVIDEKIEKHLHLTL